MRNPLSKTITTIEPSGIRKFFDIVSEMEDAISLGVGEPDFDTPWHIRDEGIYSLEKGRTFYTSNAGLKELKVEISKYLDRRFGLKYDYNKEMLVIIFFHRMSLIYHQILYNLMLIHIDKQHYSIPYSKT